jgi:hypothetical protein
MSEMKNIENLNWELLTKYTLDEASPLEKSEVENWLSQSNNNQEELIKNQKLLENVDSFYQLKNFNSNAAWKKLHSKLSPLQLKVVEHKKIRKEAIARFYKYAAILVVALLLGSFGYYIGFVNQKPAIYNEIISAEN